MNKRAVRRERDIIGILNASKYSMLQIIFMDLISLVRCDNNNYYNDSFDISDIFLYIFYTFLEVHI